MKQTLDGYSNYVLHRLGGKGGPISLIELKKDIARRGKTEGEAFLLIDAMREKGILSMNGKPGETQVELTEKGKSLYPAKRE